MVESETRRKRNKCCKKRGKPDELGAPGWKYDYEKREINDKFLI